MTKLFKITPVTLREGHDNFFTPLRIFMALMVLFGHAAMLKAGDPSAEPKVFFHYTYSYTAVNMFFIASGFLVTKSMLYRREMADFASARILRIFPALAVHVMFVAFIVGAIMTTLPVGEYLTHKDVLLQLLKVLSFYDTEMVLPGVFKNNPEELGSAALWTLRYEVLAYIGTAVLFMTGLLRARWMILTQFLICAAAYTGLNSVGVMQDLPATVHGVLRFGLAYSLGAAIYAYRNEIKLYWPVIPALFAIAAFMNFINGIEIAYNIAIAYTLFWLAYVKVPKLAPLQQLTDISYGLYIYHWVVLQVIIAKMPAIDTATLAILTLIITTALAWASWVFIEKPALGMKRRFSKLISRAPKAELTPAE